jgi:hypothetical protein
VFGRESHAFSGWTNFPHCSRRKLRRHSPTHGIASPDAAGQAPGGHCPPHGSPAAPLPNPSPDPCARSGRRHIATSCHEWTAPLSQARYQRSTQAGGRRIGRSATPFPRQWVPPGAQLVQCGLEFISMKSYPSTNCSLNNGHGTDEVRRSNGFPCANTRDSQVVISRSGFGQVMFGHSGSPPAAARSGSRVLPNGRAGVPLRASRRTIPAVGRRAANSPCAGEGGLRLNCFPARLANLVP